MRPNAKPGAPYTSKGSKGPVNRLIALEDAGPESSFAKFSFHFENDQLSACFANLKLSTMSPALLEKAKAKYGPWRNDAFATAIEEAYAKRGGARKEWRLADGRVQLEKNGFDPQVRFYIAR